MHLMGRVKLCLVSGDIPFVYASIPCLSLVSLCVCYEKVMSSKSSTSTDIKVPCQVASYLLLRRSLKLDLIKVAFRRTRILWQQRLIPPSLVCSMGPTRLPAYSGVLSFESCSLVWTTPSSPSNNLCSKAGAFISTNFPTLHTVIHTSDNNVWSHNQNQFLQSTRWV